MKSLAKFIDECGSVYAAAKKLERNIPTVHKWSKSNREFFVKKTGNKYQILEVK